MNVARERKTSVVTQLVTSGAANARDIAVAASNEFGVPLFDIDALNLDLETVRLVSDKLLAKHRLLPVFRRGKRCFWRWRIRPTCTPSMRSSSRRVSASKPSSSRRQAPKAVDKALEQVDKPDVALTDDSDVDLESWKSPAARRARRQDRT